MKRLLSQSKHEAKTISIHGLDPESRKMLQSRARSQNLSLNKALKTIIREALGSDPRKRDHLSEFTDLCGFWTEEQEREFREAIRDFEKTDPGDWI